MGQPASSKVDISKFVEVLNQKTYKAGLDALTMTCESCGNSFKRGERVTELLVVYGSQNKESQTKFFHEGKCLKGTDIIDASI